MIIYNDIEKFAVLKPRYYRFLKTININREISNDECSKYDVELVLSKCTNEYDKDLRVRCINAFDIKIGCIEGMLGLLIDIENVSSKQLEGGGYRVVEQEENAFSFYCEEFFVELI